MTESSNKTDYLLVSATPQKGIIRDNWLYIVISAVMLIGGIVIGSLVGAAVPQGTGGSPITDNPFLNPLQQLVQYYQPYQPLTVLFLFAKNALTAALSFFLGPVLLLAPAGILVLNGFAVGFVGSLVANQKSLLFVVEALAPHGVFELTALVFASAAGLRFGISSIKKIFEVTPNPNFSLKKELWGAAKLFLIALLLLAIAAVLETYLTPYLIGIT